MSNSQANESKSAPRSRANANGEPLPKRPRTREDWAELLAPDTASIKIRGMRIKPTDAFSNTTDSKRVNGFVFVGNKDVEISIPKSNFQFPTGCSSQKLIV